MRVDPRQRELARSLSKRLGIEAPLRRVYERLEPAARRDRLDNLHMRLLISFALASDGNCVDIGAHSGTILREIVRCAPLGHHIAYEPLPELASLLAREFPSVEVRNAAVSDQAGEADFFRIPADPMQSGLKLRAGAEPESETLTVRLEKLDDDLPPGYVPSLIKIDVEGAERQVIEGAIETISRHRPIVCFEHGPGAEVQYGTSSQQIYDLLVDGAGMRIFDIDGNGPYSSDQFLSVFPEPIWNFVAHR